MGYALLVDMFQALISDLGSLDLVAAGSLTSKRSHLTGQATSMLNYYSFETSKYVNLPDLLFTTWSCFSLELIRDL